MISIHDEATQQWWSRMRPVERMRKLPGLERPGAYHCSWTRLTSDEKQTVRHAFQSAAEQLHRVRKAQVRAIPQRP